MYRVAIKLEVELTTVRKCLHKIIEMEKEMSKSATKKIKKVIKGLKKASKLHAGQAKTLKTIVKKKK